MIESFRVNLDEPAETRWKHIVQAKRQSILQVLSAFKKQYIPPTGIVRLAATWVMPRMPFYDEVFGIAKELGQPVLDVIILQLSYEISMLCTSTVTAKGEHLRTLDWPLREISGLTIKVEFYKHNEHLFSAVTWAGFVGILTAMVPGAYSVSVNHRNAEGVTIMSMLFGLVSNRNMPVADAVRTCLERKRTYSEAKDYLSSVRLLAPTYFTLCGQPGQGIVITRGLASVTETREINSKTPMLVQTNADWSELAGDSHRRAMKVQQAYAAGDVYKAYAAEPVLNKITLFTSVMIPSRSIFQWRLKGTRPFAKRGFAVARKRRSSVAESSKPTKKRQRRGSGHS